jgi:hypothetical protein
MLLAKVTSSFIPSGKLCASPIQIFNSLVYSYQNKALALIDNSASANGKFKGRFIGGEATNTNLKLWFDLALNKLTIYCT